MKVLLDTCVILDFLMDREGFADDAENILMKAVYQEVEVFLTAKSICDLFCVYRKQSKDPALACQRINELLSAVSLLDSTKEDVINALSLPYSNDFEDDLMIGTSIREKMDVIVTRNLKNYSNSPIEVLSPKQFLLAEGKTENP